MTVLMWLKSSRTVSPETLLVGWDIGGGRASREGGIRAAAVTESAPYLFCQLAMNMPLAFSSWGQRKAVEG